MFIKPDIDFKVVVMISFYAQEKPFACVNAFEELDFFEIKPAVTHSVKKQVAAVGTT
jgi:hypothetical protein